MTPEKAAAAAAILLKARQTSTPIDDLPGACRPSSTEEAYAVQRAVARQLGAVGGWKVGAPGADADIACAPIFASLVVPSPARFPSHGLRLFCIEAEIAFRFARGVPAGGGRDAVLAAVGSVHPVIEVVESRFTDFRKADKLSVLADNISNGALVVGPAIADWQKLDLARPPVRVLFDGEEVARCRAGNTGGDPVRLLVGLVNHAAAQGLPVEAGQIVTTGSVTGMSFAKAGIQVVADYGDFGKVEVAFA